MTSARVPGQTDPPTRLSRRLGTFDAVVIGLGAMIGAGAFSAYAPAAKAAGRGSSLRSSSPPPPRT